MGNEQFDERYPAMFQPGGEGVPASHRWPVPAIADSRPLDVDTQPEVPAPLIAEPMAPDQSDGPSLENYPDVETTVQNPAEAAAEKPNMWLLWRIPIIIGALLVVIGPMSSAMPMWIETAKGVGDPAAASQMWTFLLADLSAPLLGVGLGLLAATLFFHTEQHPRRREGQRRLYAIAAAVVLAVGIFGKMASYIFPPIRFETMDPATGTTEHYYSSPDVVAVLNMQATGPLLVGVLMFAALAVSRKFSLARMHLIGALLLAAAVFSQCARFLFPDVPSTTEYSDDGNQGIPGWPWMLPLVTGALLTAGSLLIAGAALAPALKSAVMKTRTNT